MESWRNLWSYCSLGFFICEKEVEKIWFLMAQSTVKSTLWGHSSYPRKVLKQNIYFTCFLCLEHCSSRCPLRSLTHFLQVSAYFSPSQRGLPCSPYGSLQSVLILHPFLCQNTPGTLYAVEHFNFFHSPYHLLTYT